MQTEEKRPEIIVFAGPNGSGKSTITKLARIIEPYINADDIKRTIHCTDMEAAVKAEELREKALAEQKDFTFETVLSTDRNINLLKRAKEQGYFIRCVYILTENPEINEIRVLARESHGGHGVPVEKIRSRYVKCLKLLPELVEICDVMHIYDNSEEPFRIFKKRKNIYYHWDNKYWSYERITELTGIENYEN